jgi:hypothetical protein
MQRHGSYDVVVEYDGGNAEGLPAGCHASDDAMMAMWRDGEVLVMACSWCGVAFVVGAVLQMLTW